MLLVIKRSRFIVKRYCHSSSGDHHGALQISSVDKSDLQQNKITEIGFENKLKEIFEKKMKNDSFPLFANWSNYEKWLPVREINEKFCKLYKLPHWVKEKDLDFVVSRLIDQQSDTKGARKIVRYIAAPSAFGKTSLILPAFLRSTARGDGFTHYIYIAFRNNGEKTFKLYGDSTKAIHHRAYDHGAAFIFKCVQLLLENKPPSHVSKEGEVGKYQIKVDIDSPFMDAAITGVELRNFMSGLSSGDRKAKFLFHVDEHRDMCARIDSKNDLGAQFNKGAMETLAAHGTVIATFIDAPDLKPIGSSATVCRYPIGVPPIDIENVMKEYRLEDEKGNEYYPFHFPFDKKTLNREEKRLLATLKFKLAVKFTSLTMANVHYPNDEFKLFCKQFKEGLDETKKSGESYNTKEILVACSKQCFVIYNSVPKLSDKAVDLFLGISDID